MQNIESMPYVFMQDVLIKTSQASIEEFILDDYDRYHADHIVQMIKRRQEDLNAKDIKLPFFQGEPRLSKKSINWLMGNYVGFFHFHPYVWEKVMRCSYDEIKGYIDFTVYFSRYTPLLVRRGYKENQTGCFY
jgi:hypothetical protein